LPENKNILLLCHGRYIGYIEQFVNYNAITIDINPKAEPHIISDVLHFPIYAQFPDSSFDIIILFNCECHTEQINESGDLVHYLKRILKSDGTLYFKQTKSNRLSRNKNNKQICFINNEVVKMDVDEKDAEFKIDENRHIEFEDEEIKSKKDEDENENDDHFKDCFNLLKHDLEKSDDIKINFKSYSMQQYDIDLEINYHILADNTTDMSLFGYKIKNE
jgi:hypothetical protein